MKRNLAFLFLFIGASTVYCQVEPSVSLDLGWKFTTGDHQECLQPGFDDSGWKSVTIDKNWELQGYDLYDGFAWYRVKVFIPSQLKKKAFLKDSLLIALGKINNYDHSYLNGELLGINGKTVIPGSKPDESFNKKPKDILDIQRDYILPVNDPRIHWDQENIISIRVFDEGGMGGMYEGTRIIRMRKLNDFLTVDNQPGIANRGTGSIQKTAYIRNTHPTRSIQGKFTISFIDKLTRKATILKNEPVTVPAGSFIETGYVMKEPDGPNMVLYEFIYDEVKDKITVKDEYPYILTPVVSERVRINGPSVYGTRPGKPFLYYIPVTGIRPVTYRAENLPAGLKLDPDKGIITGRVAEPGDYTITLIAKNQLGESRKELKIKIGAQIALTPPMGWNSWNCWGLTVDQEKVVASAKVFREKGLADHGFSFINIDDGWQYLRKVEPTRDPWGYILPNTKFSNMKALGDSLHSMGLKFGIYSSPGPATCGGHAGSYQFEKQDVESYCAWGVDYLKYDWCYYNEIAKNNEKDELTKPYFVMRDELNKASRDIVYSLCQYGMGEVWKWGAEVGGNLWRTTEDINDSWESLKYCGFTQTVQAPFGGPGHWNDPDMLVLGWVGWGPALHDTNLTPDEQYTHVSLWCLLSAPLLLGCDLTRLDDFTLNLITNDEVLAINQDALGAQAQRIIEDRNIQVWVKPMEDGSKAVGIFNLGEQPANYSLILKNIGIERPASARDLWRQKDLGVLHDSFTSIIPSHGVTFVRLTTGD
jgi:hypothetical protein